MFQSRLAKYCLIVMLICLGQNMPGQQPGGAKTKFPYPEKLTYRIEWRLITAGSATISLTNPNGNLWQTSLNVQSAGLMTRLYRVADDYKVATDSHFCGINTDFEEEEGKRHTHTRLTFDAQAHKVKYDEHDFVKNTSKHNELDTPACAHEITGALTSLRNISIESGKSTTIPITDGKKLVNARIDSQGKESVVIDGKTYQTIRYEAFLFDNVLYRRKGRLFIWLTDDSERIPVQLRLQMGFPIGNISILLEEELKL